MTLEERARELADYLLRTSEEAWRQGVAERNILAALQAAVAEARAPLEAEIARLRPAANLTYIRAGQIAPWPQTEGTCANCGEKYKGSHFCTKGPN